MPLFMVQLRYDFSPGHENGSTEERPNDLVGEDEVRFHWHIGPEQPLQVEASDEATAQLPVRRGNSLKRARSASTPRVGEVRFKELRARPQPGSEGKHSSVAEIWVAGARERRLGTLLRLRLLGAIDSSAKYALVVWCQKGIVEKTKGIPAVAERASDLAKGVERCKKHYLNCFLRSLVSSKNVRCCSGRARDAASLQSSALWEVC